MLKFKTTFLIYMLTHTLMFSQSWVNPITLTNEWPAYGIGDPYILKHKGIYYLYCSTKNGEVGVKVWSSKDLSSWNYEGLCTTDPITRTAYAPEVIYWNGMFYMYTSPAGNGHYALSSESPTGPFSVISNNFGRSIDGSVFIDDDAQWYFYHSSSGGIRGCVMTGPSTMGPSLNLNAVMNNSWTEGPTVFKRNGLYYLTYTGNHILSHGYRIDYASNNTGPVAMYTPAKHQNPIILSTETNHRGLGHGSVFIGPDLDSYYFTYHNLISRNGPWRRLNFDRIAWNGEKLVVLGPTTFPQQAPEMPDQYDFFDRDEPGSQWSMPLGGSWGIENNEYLFQNLSPEKSQNMFIAVLDSATKADYTAEFNFREQVTLSEHTKIGAVFEYADSENFSYVIVNSNTNTLEVNSIRNNTPGIPMIENMPEDFDYSAWHVIKIEKKGETSKFFFDGLHISTLSIEPGGGKIGYLSENCHAHFGFIAFSNKVNGSGIFDIYKPIPGNIDAILYNSGGQGVGYHKNNTGLTGPNDLRQDGLPIIPNIRGGYAIQSFETGEWLKYNVNIRSESTYNIAFTYASKETENRISIWLGDVKLTDMILLDGTGSASKYRTTVIKDINLPSGYHEFKLVLETGTVNLYDLKFVFAETGDFDMSTNFESTYDINWRYSDGAWTIADSMATIDGFGKRTYGNPYWTDYMVETNIRFLRSMNAGMILRVNNPSLGGAGDSPHHGTDYLQGYFIGFNFSSLVLGKQNYGWQSLTSASGQYEMNQWYHLRTIIEGDRIKVYVDDMNTPVINYVDTMPFTNGRPGLRSFNTHVQFENFRVTSNTSPTSVSDIFHDKGLQESPTLYPNPALNRVTVSINGELITKIQLLGLDGKEHRNLIVDDFQADVPLEGIPPGMYLIRIYGLDRTYNAKLIVKD